MEFRSTMIGSYTAHTDSTTHVYKIKILCL